MKEWNYTFTLPLRLRGLFYGGLYSFPVFRDDLSVLGRKLTSYSVADAGT